MVSPPVLLLDLKTMIKKTGQKAEGKKQTKKGVNKRMLTCVPAHKI